MLKITVSEDFNSTRFKLEGKLVGPWVRELEQCWNRSAACCPRKSLVVDLTAVTFIDHSGQELLTSMRRRGTEFVALGCMTKSIVDEIEQGQKERHGEH